MIGGRSGLTNTPLKDSSSTSSTTSLWRPRRRKYRSVGVLKVQRSHWRHPDLPAGLVGVEPGRPGCSRRTGPVRRLGLPLGGGPDDGAGSGATGSTLTGGIASPLPAGPNHQAEKSWPNRLFPQRTPPNHHWASLADEDISVTWPRNHWQVDDLPESAGSIPGQAECQHWRQASKTCSTRWVGVMAGGRNRGEASWDLSPSEPAAGGRTWAAGHTFGAARSLQRPIRRVTGR